MAEEALRPEKLKDSEEENAAPRAPVQLALSGGGHTEGGKGAHATPSAADRARVARSIILLRRLLLYPAPPRREAQRRHPPRAAYRTVTAGTGIAASL